MRRPWEEFWEKYAPQDFMRLPWQLTHPARKKIYEIAGEIGGSVLDVGCGTGIDYLGFIDKGMKYTGLDITPKFVARFKKLNPSVDVRVGSSLYLPFPDESFSVVYSGGMIQHMHPDDYPKAIKEMWRTCQKTLILTTSKQFTEQGNIIQKVVNGAVYDNHYDMSLFLEIIHSLPRFKDVKIHRNFKQKEGGEPYTIVEIIKDAKQ